MNGHTKLDLRPERILPVQQERKFPSFLLLFAVAGAFIFGVIGYFVYIQIVHDNEQAKTSIERAFTKLNVSINDFDDDQRQKLLPILQGYTADYCDARSKIVLIGKAAGAGFIRLAAKLSVDQYERCEKDLEFLQYGSTYYRRLGDYSRSLDIINRAIELDPADADYRFSRGKIYEALQRFDKALVDQISALDLLGRPEKVGVEQYYEIATMYAALGRFCEAATPLETYISFDITRRSTPQLNRLIAEYRSKGKCQRVKTSDATSIPFKRSGGVFLIEASINGVSGLFILDTGAGLVSVTQGFANKASISLNFADQISLETANGLTSGILGTAKSIQVGNAYSTDIPIAVVDDTKLVGSEKIVGLLGMSFLARFSVTVGNNSIELRDRF